MEVALQFVGDLLGSADDEVVEGALLEYGERHLGGPAEMVLSGGGRMVADVILVPLATVVVVTGQLVEHLALVDQMAEPEDEHAGPLLVDQQHAEGAVRLDDCLELA